jgi:hypothetical protein
MAMKFITNRTKPVKFKEEIAEQKNIFGKQFVVTCNILYLEEQILSELPSRKEARGSVAG